MNKLNIRIDSIVIKNLKNVKHGEIRFTNFCKDEINFVPSILGLYGQNGSGKTTVIQAISILKMLLSGKSLSPKIVELFSYDSDGCELEFEFVLTDNKNVKYKVQYNVQLTKMTQLVDNSPNNYNDGASVQIPVVYSEKLSASYLNLNDNNDKTVLSSIISSKQESKAVFAPREKFLLLTNNDKEIQNSLSVTKRLSYEKSQSFIFSAATLNDLRKNTDKNDFNKYALNIIENLVHYAHFGLFVIQNRDNGLINIGTLPLHFRFSNESTTSVGDIALHLDKASRIPEMAYETVEKSICSINTVLSSIIPNLSIGIEQTGTEYDLNGDKFLKVQLFSHKGERKVSLSNESEGIKKLVSVLNLLIAMYNNSSVTVVIDELDAGIFEYLLGELMKIISEHAKGQLIFTSHNLRALETIDKKFVFFTTTNPYNRYIQMKYISRNNNLRDLYFHDIVLDGQDEQLYDSTNNGAIALSFYKAGHKYETE